MAGFFIFHQAIKIYNQANGNPTNFDEEPDYDSGLMGSYQYNSSQETLWGMSVIAGLFGAINLIIYLGFLIVISR
jgi:hypothetical protein